MKAIKTQYLGPTNTRGSRILASTGEKGQRLYLAEWGSLSIGAAQALAALRLCEKMGWPLDMVGGGFPDGTMAWVFASSPDRTLRSFVVQFEARLRGALGVPAERGAYPCHAVDHAHAREQAIDHAHKQGLEHVTIIAAVEQYP